MGTIGSAISQAAEKLSEAGISEPRREARSLLGFCLRRDAAFMIGHPEDEMTADETSRFEELVARRAAREPLQLIKGVQEFYGLDFEVEAGVLIPRPETELLVEQAIKMLAELKTPRFLEIGVGTGCISVSILNAVPTAGAVAVDISERALLLAARNARRHGVHERLKLAKSDLFAAVEGRSDMIVSNPPYVSSGEADSLQREVVDFDPPEALFAGEDGLDVIRRIIAEAPKFLRKDGILLLEIGQGQAESVKELLLSGQWTDTKVLPDLHGIPRTVVTRLSE